MADVTTTDDERRSQYLERIECPTCHGLRIPCKTCHGERRLYRFNRRRAEEETDR